MEDEVTPFEKLTNACRDADEGFQEAGGGGTRDWLRDFFLPALEAQGLEVVEKHAEELTHESIAICGKRCDHGSECLELPGHEGGHHTQHDCIFYDPKVTP